jgi:Uma2 family endonuclease
MSDLKTKLPTDQWVTATWDEYIQIIENPAYQKAKGYYYKEQMRVEMAPIGHDHASDNTIVTLVLNLFAGIKGIPLKGLTNCTYRKTSIGESQPDLSYYIRENTQIVARGTNIIDLNRYPPPDLAIEVSKTTLSDDLGSKRILYEDLEIAEYWVVNVKQAQVTAFAIADGGSRRITQSQVLPGFPIALLEEALQRNLQGDQSQVVTWLLAQLQAC